MNFYTPVEIPGSLPQLTHADRLMLFGSCFATHIGMRLTNAKFRCDVNPYGVLYNPLSISAALLERDMLKTICSSFVNVGTARCIMGIFRPHR